MHQVCLSLIHASIQANRLLITAQPIIADDEQKGVLIAGVSYPLSPIPLPLSLLPYPLPFRRLLRRLGYWEWGCPKRGVAHVAVTVAKTKSERI